MLLLFLCVKWMFLNEWEVNWINIIIRRVSHVIILILFWNYKRLSIQMLDSVAIARGYGN